MGGALACGGVVGEAAPAAMEGKVDTAVFYDEVKESREETLPCHRAGPGGQLIGQGRHQTLEIVYGRT